MKQPKISSPWAAAKRITTAQPETLTFEERGFRGMDARTAADRLAPGFVQNIVNGFPDGRGGIIGREGFQGQFTTPLSDPILNPLHVQESGNSYIFFASGGKLYDCAAGAATYTEILIGASSFSLPDDGENVRLVTYGKYVYGVEGGASGRAFRIDTTGGSPFVAAYIDTLDNVQNPSSSNSLHPTVACLLDGVYEYQVRPMKSNNDVYPPTGTGATVGEAVYMGSVVAEQPGPSTIATRTQKVTSVSVQFDDPAVTTGVDYYIIERRGGTLGTVDWRIVAIVEQGVDSNYGTYATRNTTSGWTWDATTFAPSNVFTDFMADEALQIPDPGDSYYSGLTLNLGEYPPVGASDITVHGGRIWLAVENTLYPSWLLEYEAIATDYGLVWTAVPNAEDAGYLSKGASFTIGGASDPDSIVCLSQSQAESDAGDYGALLIAFRQNSHTFVSGDNPSNWRAEPSRIGEYYGCLSPRAVANVDGQWVYQSPRGTQRMVTNGAPKFLGEVDGQFPLENVFSQEYIANVTAYRRISFLYYDRQLWAIVPADGPNDSPIYVWNSRTDGWSYLQGNTQFRGGVVTSGQNDLGELYLSGVNGQLFLYTGTADKATPGGSNVAYTLSVTTAAHGQNGNSGRSAFAAARPARLWADFNTESAATLSWSIATNAGITTSGTYSLAAGRNAIDFTSISDVRGLTHSVTFSVPATASTRLAGYSLTCVEQGIKR